MAATEVAVPPGEQGGAGPQPEIATLVFSDGSKYTGTLKNGTPHGLGTCVWKDGNQYDGEWRNGVMHGFGTYLWTSGQRYDGEWKDGKRDGVGVKMYADGSTFHGIWRDGMKNGVGVFKPAAKEGKVNKLIKTSSGRLMGVVAGGAGGAHIEGDSAVNLKAYESTQTTSQQPETPMQADIGAKESTHGAFASLAGAAAAAMAVEVKGEKGDKDKEKEKEKDAKEREKELEREGKLLFIRAFEDGALKREEKLSSEDAKMIFGPPPTPEGGDGRGRKARKKVKRALGLGKKLQQKHGQLLYKGMPGYDLMLRLQHGIRWSIGRGSYIADHTGAGAGTVGGPGSGPSATMGTVPTPRLSSLGAGGGGGPLPLSHVLQPGDFTHKDKVFFPAAGSSITPAHPAGDFKWKDYSPRVFRNLRNMYGIADAEYMLSLGGSSALWQLNSPGKSGCMFFLSDDERFLVKTMRKTEIKTLLELLPKYYSYMEGQPQNLVIRFFGVHGVKQVHGRTVRFVVMHNMFNTDLQIHKKFDLKGSTDGRTTGPGVSPNDPKTVFKDLDLDLQFLLDPAHHAALIRQIHNDAEFLRTVEVMDYSLLLGIHFCGRARLAAAAEAAAAAAAEGGSMTGPAGGAAPHSAEFGGLGAATAGRHPGGGGSSGGGAAGGGSAGQLQLADLHSSDAEDPGQRVSPASGRNGAMPHSPGGGGYGGGRMGGIGGPGGGGGGGGGPGAGGGGGGEDDGEHVRNFDLFSDRPDLDKQLRLFEERMRGLGYSETRIADILSLARLRFLGDKLKKRSKKAYKAYDGPTTVLKALASRRHGPGSLADGSLPRLDEGEEAAGASDEEEELVAGGGGALGGGAGAGLLGGKAGAGGPLVPLLNLGYQMRALAVHTKSDAPPEEVVLCFGIIDILQEWNTRKVVERTFKSLTHDGYAISVAPPKLYSLRFADFLTRVVFMDPTVAAARGLHLPPAHSSMYVPAVTTIEEERDSDFRHSR
ncbi:hypothetical protein HYH02_014011 [Chlamydomonas schloesseri]|uniref:1-phosphatidylinositol-4-phosphate 5-kinase n=1 Tax=Chlamydomonas schloesseri TaxID=2026947 RepID=A0A835VXN4_9CHLO|nr:hypothetical protein HYH02_014011 [Chlamydomonas schloesseri]|eukprot:KAG2429673.1 hypothetical protein HYH02_014011 [Chlamydomonas schloesseri]